MLRLGALSLAVLAILPIAAGASRALRGPERHACACPIDAEGHCQCPECIRLHVHEQPVDPHRDRDEGWVIASSCESAPHALVRPPELDPALAPVAIEAPPARREWLFPAREVARVPREHRPEPTVPPPRSS